MTWDVGKTLLWVHYLNLRLADLKLEPSGTILCSGNLPIKRAHDVPDDEALSSGQAVRRARANPHQSLCTSASVVSGPASNLMYSCCIMIDPSLFLYLTFSIDLIRLGWTSSRGPQVTPHLCIHICSSFQSCTVPLVRWIDYNMSWILLRIISTGIWKKSMNCYTTFYCSC